MTVRAALAPWREDPAGLCKAEERGSAHAPEGEVGVGMSGVDAESIYKLVARLGSRSGLPSPHHFSLQSFVKPGLCFFFLLFLWA